jgi:hypothetical protein
MPPAYGLTVPNSTPGRISLIQQANARRSAAARTRSYRRAVGCSRLLGRRFTEAGRVGRRLGFVIDHLGPTYKQASAI